MEFNPIRVITREEVLDVVAEASLFGSLGLFVGTGFSKDMTDGEAYSYRELLESVILRLQIGVPIDAPENVGRSFPEIAEVLVSAHAENAALNRNDAMKDFKVAVCRGCSMMPDPERAAVYRDAVSGLGVQWAITTNYDFHLEDVIVGSVPLHPRRFLNARSDYVPVYHLHGHVRSPESIVVTDSDYVRLLSPTDYRQLKLNLLLAESTTLMLGYSLGDINVKHAREWSRAFGSDYGLETEKYQSKVIQALYVPNATPKDPYEGVGGEWIIETGDLVSFIREFSDHVSRRREEHEQSRSILKAWLEGGQAELVADDEDARKRFVANLLRFPRAYDVQAAISFLRSVLDPIWRKAREDSGFEHYRRFLVVLTDVLETFPAEKMHPSLLAYLASRLDDVATFMHPEGNQEIGTGFSASRHWLDRKSHIPAPMIAALQDFARGNRCMRLLQFLQ